MPEFEREVEVDVPVETLWQFLIDTSKWPQWFPGIQSVSNLTGMQVNGTFEWTDGQRSGTSTITQFVPNDRLMIVTKMGNDQDSHLFRVGAKHGLLGMGGHGSWINYVLDTMTGGGILADMIAGGNPKDALRVKGTLDHFKALVEQYGGHR